MHTVQLSSGYTSAREDRGDVLARCQLGDEPDAKPATSLHLSSASPSEVH